MHAVSHGRIVDGQAHWSIAVSAIIGVQQKITPLKLAAAATTNVDPKP